MIRLCHAISQIVRDTYAGIFKRIHATYEEDIARETFVLVSLSFPSSYTGRKY